MTMHAIATIGDEEIRVAARWLADRKAEDPPAREAGIPREELRRMTAAYLTWKLTRIRDDPASQVDGMTTIGGNITSGSGVPYTVEIRPGRVVGRHPAAGPAVFTWEAP